MTLPLEWLPCVASRSVLLRGSLGGGAEFGILLPSKQRQHRTLHIQKDVLPYMYALVGVHAWRPSLCILVVKVFLSVHRSTLLIRPIPLHVRVAWYTTPWTRRFCRVFPRGFERRLPAEGLGVFLWRD